MTHHLVRNGISVGLWTRKVKYQATQLVSTFLLFSSSHLEPIYRLWAQFRFCDPLSLPPSFLLFFVLVFLAVLLFLVLLLVFLAALLSRFGFARCSAVSGFGFARCSAVCSLFFSLLSSSCRHYRGLFLAVLLLFRHRSGLSPWLFFFVGFVWIGLIVLHSLFYGK